MKTKVMDAHQVQSNLDKLKMKLSTEIKDRTFKVEPESFLAKVTVQKFHTSIKKQEFQCKMKQFLANTNDASTGNRLQGMSKDVIIVTSWPTGGLASMFKNWEYVVLSRVCTLKGLYLVESINMEKSFKPSE
jgi:hypothetical protein